MKSHLIFFLFISFSFTTSCQDKSTKELSNSNPKTTIQCNTKGCIGTYKGEEFIDRKDVAHQFSNTMSSAVGDKLKTLYKAQHYSKVEFSKITMSTKGMGSGQVIFKLSIPFIRVDNKCNAYTSFDHVGGWDHAPALERRKQELASVVLKGQTLAISDLKTTPEGLQEYWIQWKNKATQAECE